MDLWLLGGGALILIAIALWIVWPARTADLVGATVQTEEVSRTAMTENMTPQGARFEDQYTNATGDLSAGGVATALGSMQGESTGHSPSVGSTSRWSPSSTGVSYSSPLDSPTETRSMIPSRKVGVGAGALLSLGGAVGGAWLYARWHRERNKPINRLRRGAHDVASRLGERLPDVEDLPHAAAPMSGAATALLLTGLLATRALRRDSGSRTEEMRDQASGALHESLREALGRGREAMARGKDLGERGRKESRRLGSRFPTDRLPSHVEPRKPAVMGIGFGGLAVLAGGTYLVWRMLRGGSASASWTSSYAAE
jgi:hypothetical protein